MKSNTTHRMLLACVMTILICTSVAAQTAKNNAAMGFDVDKAVHHFYLLKNGGAIELSAKDAADASTIKALQQHLEMQAKNFEKGNFDTQMQVHGKLPDGVLVMKKYRNEITFDAKRTDSGATLRMFTVNPQAKQAIQDFLKFQINEHQTGDPLTVD